VTTASAGAGPSAGAVACAEPAPFERRARFRGRATATLNPSQATLQSLFGTDEAGRLSFGAFAGALRWTLRTQQARGAVAREAPPFEATQAAAR
jgi:hypothetical protein